MTPLLLKSIVVWWMGLTVLALASLVGEIRGKS